MGIRRASGSGAKEDPACSLLRKCLQGQGCSGGLQAKTLASTTLLEAFPRVTVPVREEEVGCHNPLSVQACLGHQRSGEGACSLVTAAERGFGTRHTLPPPSLPPRPPPSSVSGIPRCGAWQFQSRGGGGSSAQGSLQPGCWAALMGCGRCGFGPLGQRRERSPGLPLPQHIL